MLGPKFSNMRGTVSNSETVDNIASNHKSNFSGLLRLFSPPSISDSFLTPWVGAFQVRALQKQDYRRIFWHFGWIAARLGSNLPGDERIKSRNSAWLRSTSEE
jgi:hypothetical protein